MNIKEYIESGVLEAYVLGALPKEEHAQVAADIEKYPELKAEVAAIENAMLQYAETTSETPPPFLQEQIWNAINENNEQKIVDIPHAPKVIALSQPEKANNSWLRAAIWVALLGSVVTNFVLLSQKKEMHEGKLALQQSIDTLEHRQEHLASVIADFHKEGDMLADSNMQTIVMKSLKPGHPMVATVYWNKTQGQAYLSMKKLPMPPKGMQYQMWVIQDGKPVSMGVLPNEMIETPTVALLQMQVNNGQAFAISLEKEGGNATPTPENIYVLGKTT